MRKLAEIPDLIIHDLRHFATTMLFMEGVAEAVIRKLTGHRSEELERYKHFSPTFKQQTVELIAGGINELLGTNLGTPAENPTTKEKSRSDEQLIPPDVSGLSGGADGTRTRDLRRDRLKSSYCSANIYLRQQ